jgi:hypothetical protein
MQVLRFVVIHLPGKKSVSSYAVSESAAVSDQGAPVTCYSATAAPRPDGFDRHYRWCFDSSSGLLASEDYPLDLHITYGNYIPFQGKQEFTKVHVTESGIPVLDLDIQYAPLDPHALDGLAPTAAMKQIGSASPAPNSEEVEHGTVEYRYPNKGHGRAVVAVARHLAEASYWVLRKKQHYRAPQPRIAG